MISQILRELIAAGLQGESLVAAVERIEQAQPKAMDATAERRRAKDRERYYLRKRQKPPTPPTPPKSTETEEVSLSSSLLSSSISTTKQQEKKEERKKERARKIPVPPDWRPNEAHYTKAANIGMPVDLMLAKADDMRNWAKSKAVIRADWDATFFGFLRPRDSSNGHGGTPRPGSKEDTRERTVNALRALDPFPREDEPRPSESSGSPVFGLVPVVKLARS
jgi:hypothetical protein